MNWLFFAVLAGVFYGLYGFVVKVVSGKIDSSMGIAVIQAASLLPVLAYFFWMKSSVKQLLVTREGLILAVIGGLLIGISAIGLILNFSAGGKLSVSIPIVVGINIVVAALLGVVVLHETITPLEIAGLILTFLGVILLSHG